MSSQYTTFYSMSQIPCADSAAAHDKAELGIVHPNIDGRSIGGGVQVAGQCLYGATVGQIGGISVPGYRGGLGGLAQASARTLGNPKASTQVMALYPVDSVRYASASMQPSVNNFNTARLAASLHL